MDTQSDVITTLSAELGDDPELRELVTLFVRGLEQRASAIEQALTNADVTALRREAHRLTGTARSFGFPTLAWAADDLASVVREHLPMEMVRASAQKLADLCRRARLEAPSREK